MAQGREEYSGKLKVAVELATGFVPGPLLAKTEISCLLFICHFDKTLGRVPASNFRLITGKLNASFSILGAIATRPLAMALC